MSQSPIEPDAQSTRTTGDKSTHPEEQTQTRPFLIYNKISAVINETTTLSPVEEPNTPQDIGEPHTAKDSKVGNSVWYEYGCV